MMLLWERNDWEAHRKHSEIESESCNENYEILWEITNDCDCMIITESPMIGEGDEYIGYEFITD